MDQLRTTFSKKEITCSDYNVPVFFDSGETGNLLVNFSHIPSIVVFGVLAVALFLRNKNNSTMYLLLSWFASLSLWMLFDWLLWNWQVASHVYVIWSLTILVELVFFASVYLFLKKINTNAITKTDVWTVFALCSPAIFLLPTAFGVSGVYLESCLAIEGFTSNYMYGMETIFILGAMYVFIKNINNAM